MQKIDTGCYMCPRKCGVDRLGGKIGFCGCGFNIHVAKIMLHTFEEPCISGTAGSGAIFFYGCNLRCGYCQNAKISNFRQDCFTTPTTTNPPTNTNPPNPPTNTTNNIYSPAQLAQKMLELQTARAHNINLVTAAHYVNKVAEAIKIAKNNGLKIPVVYNTSSYELVDAIKSLSGLVDVFLPDYKYYNSDLAQKYSAAPDYPSVARAAITQMLRQQPKCEFDSSGIIQKGVILRHLVLPGQKQDSCNIIEDIAINFKGAMLSLMCQYTPDFNNTGDPSLNRRVTTYEYNTVLNKAADLNIPGYMQLRDSARKQFTPDF